ncbi:MAG: hypothetical protein BWY92_01825 [Firmicutes bacterium ADurb.BinA052]|nr:MAG: hypothetical protein BWY92_01825 [Firmicutes bacterium ADurb.BinA052]
MKRHTDPMRSLMRRSTWSRDRSMPMAHMASRFISSSMGLRPTATSPFTVSRTSSCRIRPSTMSVTAGLLKRLALASSARDIGPRSRTKRSMSDLL